MIAWPVATAHLFSFILNGAMATNLIFLHFRAKLAVQVTDVNQVDYQLLELVGFWCGTFQRLWVGGGCWDDLVTWLLNW